MTSMRRGSDLPGPSTSDSGAVAVLLRQPAGEVEVGAVAAGDVLRDDEVRAGLNGFVEGLVDER